MKTRRIQDLTWEQFRDLVPASIDLVLIPVGTLEAHGGIPLGTDIAIPESMAVPLAERLGALVAPAVPYGVTNTLLPYPGSTTVSSDAFKTYLFESAAGLVDAGFRRVVLLNGHGGQSAEVGEVVARLWGDKRAYAAAFEWWGVAAEASSAVYGAVTSGHAGVEETAMMIAIAPEHVDGARAAAIRRAPRQAGLRARPFPASVILDGPETNGNGAPVLDAAKARDFHARCLDAAENALRELFAGWAEIGARRR